MPVDSVHMSDSAAQLGRWKRFQQCLESSGLDQSSEIQGIGQCFGLHP